jgi:hypothetical protein
VIEVDIPTLSQGTILSILTLSSPTATSYITILLTVSLNPNQLAVNVVVDDVN